MGPLLMVLLFLVAATGAIKAIDIFTPFGSQVAGNETYITITVLFLCLAMCTNAARTDYISFVAAAIPCFVTVMVFTALSMTGTWPKSSFSAAVMQASVSSFAALSMITRLVQSGGPDLGKIGVYWRSAKARVRHLKAKDVNEPDFKTKRAALVGDVELLAKELKDAAPQVIDPGLCKEVEKRLQSFVAFSKLASHPDFFKAAADDQQSLATTLSMLNQGLT